MRRKPAAAAVAAVLALAAAAALAPPDDSAYREAFDLEAAYDDGTIRVTFTDRTGQAGRAVLEVLGMRESFQREFSGSFEAEVPYGPPPSMGWKVAPVTVAVEHPELGRVGVKTEVRGPGEPEPAVIFGPL